MLLNLRTTGLWPELTPDGRLLFSTRIARLFAYGFLSVVLVLYLTEVGLTETQIGLLLTLTLVGDTVISLWITTTADRIGRRRMLIVGAGLMLFAGLLFAVTRNVALLKTCLRRLGTVHPSFSPASNDFVASSCTASKV